MSIRCDNGPAMTSRLFLAWCLEKKIELFDARRKIADWRKDYNEVPRIFPLSADVGYPNSQ